MANPEVLHQARTRRAVRPTLRVLPALSPQSMASNAVIDELPSAVRDRARWQRRYARRLVVTDGVVVAAAVTLAQYVRFGDSPSGIDVDTFYVTGCSVLIAVMWLTGLSALRTRSPKIVGSGIEEYRRVGATSFATFGTLAIAELLLKMDISRGYLAVALPAGALGLLIGRWLNRRHLAARRAAGECQTSVLAIGDRAALTHLVAELTSDPTDGYRVVGVCIPGYETGHDDHLVVRGIRVPVLGGECSALTALRSCGADTVAVASTGHFGVQALRRLIWDLEPVGVDLVVCPGVVDVALSRLVMRPISGLSLLQIEKPQYRQAMRIQKRAFDSVFAAAALTVTAPVLALAAIAIKVTSPGPVFYRAERIGIDGRPFSMLKLRSMVVGADRQTADLVARNDCDGPLFKMRDDPRVTPVGRILRRFSIDELPQFLNVLRQEMSVVGPRPPLRCEVESYDGDVVRRLLVRPGITGLWQISGRSDLPWEKSVRLDLSYVDNWSLTGDIVIIVHTLRAVLRRTGAY